MGDFATIAAIENFAIVGMGIETLCTCWAFLVVVQIVRLVLIVTIFRSIKPIIVTRVILRMMFIVVGRMLPIAIVIVICVVSCGLAIWISFILRCVIIIIWLGRVHFP